MSKTEEALEEAVEALAEVREEIGDLCEFFEENHPHEWRALKELQNAIPSLQDDVKAALRKHGQSTTVGDHKLTVAFPTTKVVNVDGLMAEAKERGDMHTLEEHKVFVTTVDPNQIERLPSRLEAIYGKYVEVKKGTGRVTLPSSLK
jgi:hypothetical protein